MKKLRVVFMGTPAFAVPSLQALLQTQEVAAVLTQPDRPSGRGNRLAASPVKEAALAAGIPILQPHTLLVKKKNNPSEIPIQAPKSLSDEVKQLAAPFFNKPTQNPDLSIGVFEQPHSPEYVRAQLKKIRADVFIVAAYGLILPKAILEMPRLSCINVHASLLPRYRGASPIHAAILNGDTTTGITIMHMAEGIDTGDIILQKSLSIAPDEHFPSLHGRMAALGSEALTEALTALQNNTATRTPQDEAQATHTQTITKADGKIDWTQPANTILNKIRAYDPWPGAYTILDNTPLKIWRAEVLNTNDNRLSDVEKSVIAPLPGTAPHSTPLPGTILAADNRGLLINTSQGILQATELQGSNSKKMPAADYVRGRAVKPGIVL